MLTLRATGGQRVASAGENGGIVLALERRAALAVGGSALLAGAEELAAVVVLVTRVADTDVGLVAVESVSVDERRALLVDGDLLGCAVSRRCGSGLGGGRRGVLFGSSRGGSLAASLDDLVAVLVDLNGGLLLVDVDVGRLGDVTAGVEAGGVDGGGRCQAGSQDGSKDADVRELHCYRCVMESSTR